MGDRGQRQIIVGMIVSDKMQKTVKVEEAKGFTPNL